MIEASIHSRSFEGDNVLAVAYNTYHCPISIVVGTDGAGINFSQGIAGGTGSRLLNGFANGADEFIDLLTRHAK